jgi:pyruvate formate lyase activating enzyme
LTEPLMIEFAGLTKQSLSDYPGRIAAVLFTRGCNLRCPFCHNPHLLGARRSTGDQGWSLKDVLKLLEERKGFLDGVVITGGEPTLNPGLPSAIRLIKEMGYLVKLDTNGTGYEMVRELLQEELVDYIAMDIKAPLDMAKYYKACGRLHSREFLNIRNTILMLKEAPIPVEFRTTVVPGLHTLKDIIDIARQIQGASLYTLQQFRPEITLNPSFGKIVPFSAEELQQMALQCSAFVKQVRVVNI